MKKLKITRYADPGHSWFKVPRKLLKVLNIEEKISAYSRQYGEFVYLEEDGDFAVFLRAYMKLEKTPTYEEWNKVIIVNEKWTNKSSKIRGYASFKANFKPFTWEVGKRVKLYGKEYITSEGFNGQKTLKSVESEKIYRVSKMQIEELEEVSI